MVEDELRKGKDEIADWIDNKLPEDFFIPALQYNLLYRLQENGRILFKSKKRTNYTCFGLRR